MATVLAWAEKQGPESGGGGVVAKINSRLQLIDFYTIAGAPEFLELKYQSTKPSVIDQEQEFSFHRQDQVNNVAFNQVLNVFNTWSLLPYDVIGLTINSAIYNPVIWNFSDQEVVAPKFYLPSPLRSGVETATAAYYLKVNRLHRVSISRKIWNELKLQDQVGLLIHESLRHVQIGFSFSFDDEALQKATAIMMVCRPSVKLDQYLFFLLNNRRDLAEQRFEAFEQLTKECWR